MIKEIERIYKEMAEGIDKLSMVKTSYELLEFLKNLGQLNEFTQPDYCMEEGWNVDEYDKDYSGMLPCDEEDMTEEELNWILEDLTIMNKKVQAEIKMIISYLKNQIKILED